MQGRGHMREEAEIGAMQPQTKELQKLGGGEEGFLPRAFGSRMAHRCFDFKSLDSIAINECLKPFSFWAPGWFS